jgi:hypothetical protein
MAVSKNDPDNWPHVVYDDFPEPRGKTLTRTVFQWLTVTVDRVWSGNSYGIKFVEDTGGDIWNISGPYNEELFKFESYDGYQYQPGEKVDAQLSLRTYNKNDGSVGVGRSITKIRMNNEYARTAQPADDASPAEQPVPTEGYVDKWDLKDIHIRKAQALNLLTEVLTSGDKVNAPKIVLAMGFTDAAEAIDAVANGWNSLRRGLPIEFPVAVSDTEEEVEVEAAVEAGAVKEGENVEQLKW